MKRTEGISLTEILIVVVIVGALMAISLVLFRQRAEARSHKLTAERIRALEEKIELLRSKTLLGREPTSDPERFHGPDGRPVAGHSDAENQTNCGIESLVLAIRLYGGEFTPSVLVEALVDVDGDRTLLEVVDGWGNPYVYIECTSYEKDAAGVKAMMADGRVVLVRPLRDPATGAFRNESGHQLISAGSDGEFGTKDDVTN